MVIVSELERMKTAAASRESRKAADKTVIPAQARPLYCSGPLSWRNHFFLLFGFLTSFFAPCREAAMPITSFFAGSQHIPATAFFYFTSPSSAGLPWSSAGFTVFFSSLRCLFSSFFFCFASSFWRFWKLKFGFPTHCLLMKKSMRWTAPKWMRAGEETGPLFSKAVPLFDLDLPSGSGSVAWRSGRLRRTSRPRSGTGWPRSLEEFPLSLLRLQLLPLFLHRGLFVKAPLLQFPENPVELEFLFQVTQGLFDVPGLDPYLQDRPPPPP
jgi:hypothetical protein